MTLEQRKFIEDHGLWGIYRKLSDSLDAVEDTDDDFFDEYVGNIGLVEGWAWPERLAEALIAKYNRGERGDQLLAPSR